MSDDMVKKSVDITEEDEKWLNENPINFSKFCRRKIAEKRLEQIPEYQKARLYRNIVQMNEKAKELTEEHNEEREKLKEEYNCEVIEKQSEYWIFEHEGEEYYGHWMPGQVFEDTGTSHIPEEAEEFGNKYVQNWADKIDEFGEFVNEKTYFNVDGGDELNLKMSGEGPLEKFSISVPYLPTDIESFRIKFDDRADMKIQELEKSIDSEF